MDTSKLKKFAQFARRSLMAQVSTKLSSVLAPGALARREYPAAMKKLEAAIAREGEGQVIERVAHTWFNRFSALRYMDVNDLNPVRVVSPLSGQFQPEILAEAKAGNIDEERIPEKIRAKVGALLDGRISSSDAQAEAYRLLLVAICNDWHRVMPFMFERIDDYTELLLPEDLLSNASILAYLREAMTPDASEDVEVIGWLYQFYISEKKDEVFAGLKKNVKITAENIPAATQLFTRHWIVRYLVENSLGRLWLLNRPQSKLAAQMDYYIAPEEPETEYLRVDRPEQIRICDPACGSGHMLTYAFDLLHAIYEEEGYEATHIPALILTHNLHGVEIDDRAGTLAAFALAMKAAARLGRRRILRLGIQPNICVMQDVRFTPAEIKDVSTVVGRDLFTAELRETLGQFEQAKNFGSLIVPQLRDPDEVARVVRLKDFGGDLLLREMQERVLKVLEMAEALSPKYHVVVANPPYMGKGGMNGRLSDFVKDNYNAGKADLFAPFIDRGFSLLGQQAYNAMVTMHSWMFLSTFEKFRSETSIKGRIVTLCQMSNMVMGIAFGTAASVWKKGDTSEIPGQFTYVTYDDLGDDGEPSSFPAANERTKSGHSVSGIFSVKSRDFAAIPGRPISFWLSPRIYEVFRANISLGDVIEAGNGLQTNDNEAFLRRWFEVGFCRSNFSAKSRVSAQQSGRKWFPYNKGGEYRKWYGNHEYVIDWECDGRAIKNRKERDLKAGKITPNNSKCWNEKFYFEPSVTWSDLTSGKTSFRKSQGSLFDITAPSAFENSNISSNAIIGFLNTKLVSDLVAVLNPTMHFNTGNLRSLPWKRVSQRSEGLASNLVSLAKADWDAYETSWDFATLPLLEPGYREVTLEATYARLRAHWRGMTDEMQRLEEENNRIFIDAYGLQDELTPEVPIEEITLTCNPAYRYGVKGAEEERETRLLADTLAEFISYAVGCMFGRYSLDAPSLILANQGETLADYLTCVSKPSFMPDEDNVIPVLDSDWFADDITDRFRRFLRVTFGEEHFQENLAFVEEALGKDIRRYFTRDFFNDHVKTYKRRPIYWLFSSPKGTFNALIYMHRCRPDTVSVVLNDYLREFRSKLEAHRRAQEALSISGDASPAQKTKALKEIEATARQIEELDAWERDVLFPLATQKIEIDLDDGVKANYPKFGAALKPIKGLNDSDD